MSAFLQFLNRRRVPLVWISGFLLFSLFIIWNLGTATFFQFLLLGIPQGAVIALIAVGYSMVYGIIQLINFAHGEVFMFSAYFVLMFVAVPTTDSPTLINVMSCTVFFLTTCAAWVLLDLRQLAANAGGRWMKVLAAPAIGCAFALLNYKLMPRLGATAGLGFPIAWALAIFYSCCLGVSMDLLAYRPLRNSPRLIPLITAIGISLFLQNYAQALFESRSRAFPLGIAPDYLGVGARRVLFVAQSGTEINVAKLDLWIVSLAVVLLGGLLLFVHHTRAGKAMRACAQDRTTAALMGIKVNHSVALAFALGAGLAAVVAPLYVLRGTFMSPQMGYIVGILAFASAVLGGIGNIAGAMLGGVIIGIIAAFVPLFDAFDRFRIFQLMEARGWVTRAGFESFITGFGKPGQYQLGIAYAFMILVIVLRPQGLLGRAAAKRA